MMKKNCYSMCPTCVYAEYLGLGEVGCFDDNPPCMRNLGGKPFNRLCTDYNENLNPDNYNNGSLRIIKNIDSEDDL